MVKIEKNIKGFVLKEFWFSKELKFSELFSVTSYRNYIGNNPKLMFKEISYTIEIDLLQTEEEIFGAFKSNFKNEIRKAEKLNFNFKINKLSIIEFIDFYNSFAIAKGLKVLSLPEIQRYNQENLMFMCAHSKDGELLVSHAYLIDGVYSRLLYSASQIHDLEDKEKRKLIGFFNKRLHWIAIKYFKNKSYKIYDWGGYAKDTEITSLKGINAFKMSFGGKVKRVVNYNSFLFEIIRKISSLR